MIIHNTSPVLCNGTRVIYHRRVGKTLEVEVANGVHKGEIHYVPRLVLTTKEASIPFTLKRIQYAMQACFAMCVLPIITSTPHAPHSRLCVQCSDELCFRTVHKAQGQTLDRVGIYFNRDTWAHGLLYVAVSRVRRLQDCFFVGVEGGTVFNCCSPLLR